MSARTIVALMVGRYGRVYHIAEDGVTLCGRNARGKAWVAHSWPPTHLQECQRCRASTRRFVGEKDSVPDWRAVVTW